MPTRSKMSSNALPAHDHLLVDGPEVLRPTGHLGGDVHLGQTRPDLGDDLVDVGVALGCAVGDHVVDLGVALRVQRGEAQVLELLLDLLHAQAVGQRRVDVERLLGGALLLPRRQRGDRAHVVQTVGELDDQDAQVLRHRHEHLAHRGGLLGLLGVEVDPLELGDAVDDRGDLGTEVLVELLQGDDGVLDRVVQERGGDGDVVHPVAGDDAGDRERMGDVGLTRPAQLTLVGAGGHPVRLGDGLGRAPRVELAELLDDLLDLHRGRLAVPPPGQDAGHRGHVAPLGVNAARTCITTSTLPTPGPFPGRSRLSACGTCAAGAGGRRR